MLNGISSAISALKAYGKRITNSSNNISNLNTNGFKKSRSASTPVAPAGIATASGSSQVGRGAVLEEISRSNAQGSFESTDSPTDMAIAGDGFFMVATDQGKHYFTRNGKFNINNSGMLVNNQGYSVQGWKLAPESGERKGGIQDIRLTSFASTPSKSSKIVQFVNLDAGASTKANGPGGLAGSWKGNDPNGNFMSDSRYEYQTKTKVFDNLGASHDLTTYFDKGKSDGSWDYVVTANPAEDSRLGANGENLGLLARGSLKFDNSGEFKSMTMDTNDGKGNWTAVEPDPSTGHFLINPDFQGNPDGGSQMNVQLDFGARYNGSNWVKGTQSSTQYNTSSHTINSFSDGFGAGDLLSLSVGTNGVIKGSYSNGENLNLFQVATAKFHDPGQLKSIGGGLLEETRASGAATTGTPGSGGLGALSPNSLEQSNVDLGEEFASMILFKQGYEANLKSIQIQSELKGEIMNIVS